MPLRRTHAGLFHRLADHLRSRTIVRALGMGFEARTFPSFDRSHDAWACRPVTISITITQTNPIASGAL